MIKSLPTHIVQSPEWGEFKTKTGRQTYLEGNAQFSTHQLPFTPIKIGYCPKIDPASIDWPTLQKFAQKNHFCAIRFDTPNIPTNSNLAPQAIEIFEKHCQKIAKHTFAEHTIFLDLTPSESTLLSKCHPKTRYNISLAERKGVTVSLENNQTGIDTLIKLQKETATRQGFYVHPDHYYQTLWQTLFPKKMANILVARFENEPLTAWMLFNYQEVLYYPYGASSDTHRNLMASNLVAWKAILLGKKLNCRTFDMWGASDPNQPDDPWSGFTRFKLSYGGQLIKFISSYDLIINPVEYKLFNLSYNLAWKFLRLKKRLPLRQ
jgi:lipid II:glycine glycyltransferase (peptidoglycan interpeptide bridge formation enzyme)